MLIILSSAKTMDFDDKSPLSSLTSPIFTDESQQLVQTLSQFSPQELESLLKVSPKLAQLNYQRLEQFSQASTQAAILAYRGDVFKQLTLSDYQEKDYQFAQAHLRIISGLYGWLRPLDQIKPYRLEMNTPLKLSHSKHLYEFWTEKITSQLSKELSSQSTKILVNLASNEYSKVIDTKQLNYPVLNISFKEMRQGKLKTIGLIAKKHRGMMTNWIIRQQIDSPVQLQDYGELGYRFNEELSSEWNYVFLKNE